MPGELVFVTGATGFIGSATALGALKAGYRLRIAVRKPSDILQKVLSEYESRVEYVTVPDISREDSYEGKLDGVDFVLHLASPLSAELNYESFVGPAVNGTTAILKAAAKVPSIKKVVITASLRALMPLTGPPQGAVIKEDTDWDLSVDEKKDYIVPNNPRATYGNLYHVSKLLADKVTWDFRESAKPGFALVVLYPALVVGHNLVQTTAEQVNSGSNAQLWHSVMGGTPAGAGTFIALRDVVTAQVRSLDPKVKDGSKYLISGKPTSWKEIAEIVQRNYPDAGAKLTTDAKGESAPTDTTKAERDLGMQWLNIEDMVREVMDQQLAFAQKSA